MPYPEPLLPRAQYKQEIVPESLILASPDFYLIRISMVPIQDPDNIKIRELCSSTKDFVGLSTNLFGVFEPAHLPYKPIDRPQNDYWVKANGSVDPNTINYMEVDGREPIFIKLHSLHDRELPASKIIDQKSLTITIKVRLAHKPTKPNYWHFEVKVFNLSDQPEFNREHLPDWAKNAIKKFIEIDICHKASGRLPASFEIIPDAFFIDQTD